MHGDQTERKLFTWSTTPEAQRVRCEEGGQGVGRVIFHVLIVHLVCFSMCPKVYRLYSLFLCSLAYCDYECVCVGGG